MRHAITRWRSSVQACRHVSKSPRGHDDDEIMGVRHMTLPIEGVQFHPESILTEHGHVLLGNFLRGRR